MLGVIGAMPEEIELIKSHLKNVSEQSIGGEIYYHGEINGQKLILCKSGIGKVQSAFSAALLMNVLGVKAVIFTGVAGGVQPYLSLGDVVIGTDFLYHDFDATAIGYALGEIPDDSQSVFQSHEQLSSIVAGIAEESFGNGKVYRGRIVSGDQFVASHEKIEQLQQLFNAYAVDMESASVAHIANKNQIPCCVIRAISDKADGVAADTYSGFFTEAAKNSASLIIKLMSDYNIADIIA
ncbi:MAG: 5'-methylthioadenosine/adenosylhomocysteine nucleosidase [Brevinemataceae bacterium]